MKEEEYQLIVAYFEKTISDDGLTQLRDWIEESMENLETFSETIQILDASKAYFKQPDSLKKNWVRISTHVNSQKKEEEIAFDAQVSPVQEKTGIKWISHKWLSYAAVLLLLSAASVIGYKYIFHHTPLPVEYTQMSNRDGQHSKIILPDNSVIYLGGGSKLRFAKKFEGRERIVYLNGEAFFEVVHNPKRPFVVKSGKITTIVLGTSFNVKAFAAKNKVAVTVNTGKVGVMATMHGKSQLVKFLLPDEQLEINTKNGLYTFNATDAAAVSGWMNNNFVFYNTSLKEITASLEHHYGIKMEFTDAELEKIRLTAKFNDMPIKQVLDNLSALSGLTFTQKGNHIFISGNNQRGGKIMK